MFKDILKQLIQKNGLSSYQISRDTGITESLISHWKSGRQLPKYDSLKILADYFNVSGDYLLERTDIKDSVMTFTKEEQLTEQERKLLSAYRQNPNMQEAVNKLLGIETKTTRAIRVARSNSSTVETVYDDFSDLINAPETDEDL